MAGLCEGGNEPSGSLKAILVNTHLTELRLPTQTPLTTSFHPLGSCCTFATFNDILVLTDGIFGIRKRCGNPLSPRGDKEVPAANSWIIKQDGLSSSEWREMLKMTAMVAPVRSLPGRSTGTTHCRHCSEYETLPHVLGSCPQGEVLRIKRHNTIRSMIADALRSKNLDVHEEFHCIADGGSNRRIDIIAINRNKQTAEIIDPTIRFEISATQPSEVNEEKKKIYEPTIQYLSVKYNIEKITVTGLFFGAGGIIPKAFVMWREKYKLTRDLQDAIDTTIIKFSVAIFRQHLYGVHSI
ncbi:hypothetical protein ANN_02350 [Periplaneta americana]|uniref:Reverse transcriptase n=1 Tax=Periplaneta americana TaxID=6978 RepID=A0ABQ8TYI5_PERAM|nr:hypothetical protein ANN_02350 [Periplaneta americana]